MPSLSAVRRVTAVPVAPPIAPPRTPIAVVDAVSHPARTFTGDFYFTHRADDRLWLAIGDVAGKGLPAAVIMAMIQEELEARVTSCATRGCDPSATLARLHEFLLPLMPQNRFATAVIAQLHPDGLLTVANAGHCPPLLVRADGSIEELTSTGPILGLLRDARWRSVTTHLNAGDTLVLYSDGVIEATRCDEELGVAGLREIVRHARTSRAILQALEDYERGDDTTLLVIRRE